MTLREISHGEARPFIEAWHYSKCVPTGHNIFFGWFNGDELYAVANYGWGVNPYQEKFLTRVTGYPVDRATCLELKRLCRVEPRDEIAPLTKFLSKCHGELRRRGIHFIVSFSDPEYGHSGGIYKAASFQHLGQTAAERHVVDKDGNKLHRRVAYRHSRRNGISISESRKQLGLTPIITKPKDRWFKVIAQVSTRSTETRGP